MPIYRWSQEAAEELEPTTFAKLGLSERGDIQRILRDHIGFIDPDILVIAEEFGSWDHGQRRIDLLGIDRQARIVVIELKRTQDGGHMELQAIRYAAMVSTMTFTQACETFEKYLSRRGIDEDAHSKLRDHLGVDMTDEVELSGVRIVLVSANFSKELTTAVLWLCDQRIDIRCIRIVPYEHMGQWLIDIEQLIPLPQAAPYIVGIRDKRNQQENVQKQERDLTRYTVTVDGHSESNLAKRRAILCYIKGLVKAGIHPMEIDKAISWRTVVYEVPDSVVDAEIGAYLGEKYGIASPGVIWFLKPDELIHHDGKTFAIARQWSKRTHEALQTWADTFGPAHVNFEVDE